MPTPGVAGGKSEQRRGLDIGWEREGVQGGTGDGGTATKLTGWGYH